jgi:hypothetical protein
MRVPRTVRSMSTLRAAIGGTVATLGFIALAVFDAKLRVQGITLAATSTVMTWRSWVAGIRIEPTGIKVVGFLLSRRFAWDKVDHFAVLPLGGYPYVGHAVLRGGLQVGMYGLGAPGRPKSSAERFRLQVQGPVDQLNEALEQWRAEHGVQQSRSLPQ